MVARLTSNQKAAGSSPASGNYFAFLMLDVIPIHIVSVIIVILYLCKKDGTRMDKCVLM